MKKEFDPTKPHKHQCTNCWKQIYCANARCEIPRRAVCLECVRASSAVEHFDYDTNIFKNASGYRKTWPGRFTVEHYTLPYSDAD